LHDLALPLFLEGTQPLLPSINLGRQSNAIRHDILRLDHGYLLRITARTADQNAGNGTYRQRG
jgi:hypothetical protein